MNKDLKEAAFLLLGSINEAFGTEGDLPNKFNSIFRADDNIWQMNACINFTRDDLAPYVDGYLQAARLISQMIFLTGAYLDILIYPLVYLYRHHLELVIKSVILKSNKFNDSSSGLKRALQSHDLEKLWKFAGPIVGGIIDDENMIYSVKLQIMEISAIDHGSFSFRYPRAKNGAKLNLAGTRHVNVYHFVNEMEKIVDIFETCMNALDYSSNEYYT